MDDKKSFLKILEDRDIDFNFRLLTEDGYGEKLKIPVDWIYSKDITRDDFVQACEKCIKRATIYMSKIKGINPQEGIEKYKKTSQYKNPGKDHITDFEIKKDEDGKVYLLIKGLDDYTQVVVHQDEHFINLGKAFRIKESKFVEILKEISDKRKVEEFLQQNGGSLNSENLDIKKIYDLIGVLSSNDVGSQFTQAGRDLARYANYMRTQQENNNITVIKCSVAEEDMGKRGPRMKSGRSAPDRLNDVIDSKQRYDALNSLEPEYIIKINPEVGSSKKYQFQAYTYDLSKRNKGEDGTVIIIEPENGTSYTRVVHISSKEIEGMMANEEIGKLEVFERAIAENLGKTRSDLTRDKKTILTNHTNIDAFKAKADYFVRGKSKVLKDHISTANEYNLKNKREGMLEGPEELE